MGLAGLRVRAEILMFESPGALVYMVFFSEMEFYGESYKPKDEVSWNGPTFADCDRLRANSLFCSLGRASALCSASSARSTGTIATPTAWSPAQMSRSRARSRESPLGGRPVGADDMHYTEFSDRIPGFGIRRFQRSINCRIRWQMKSHLTSLAICSRIPNPLLPWYQKAKSQNPLQPVTSRSTQSSSPCPSQHPAPYFCSR